jgi:hypothetical protein
MTLDDELRSAFAQEAATRIAPPPDPEGLIRGGRVRRRRRNLERAGAGAVAAVLIGAGGYGTLPDATHDPGVASRPSGSASPGSPPPSSDGRSKLAPGTYRMFVGSGAAGERIEADFTVGGDNWNEGDFPLAGEDLGTSYAGIGVYQPQLLAAGSGCLGDTMTSVLGRGPRRLAQQLAALPRSAVVEAPTPTHVFGHDGFHLRLEIRADCQTFYRVAATPNGDRGITYTALGAPANNVLIDFWVLEVAGAPVVVDEWHNVTASLSLVEQAARARTSIELVVGD